MKLIRGAHSTSKAFLVRQHETLTLKGDSPLLVLTKNKRSDLWPGTAESKSGTSSCR